MPARLSDVARAAKKWGVDIEPHKSGKHPFKFRRDNLVYPVKAHNGMRSELADGYIKGMCLQYGIPLDEFLAELRGTPIKSTAPAVPAPPEPGDLN